MLTHSYFRSSFRQAVFVHAVQTWFEQLLHSMTRAPCASRPSAPVVLVFYLRSSIVGGRLPRCHVLLLMQPWRFEVCC